MRLLITLDFPPENGGIQRYLGDIVAHTYAEGDLVLSGGTAGRGVDDRVYPCRILHLGKWFPFIKKKMLLPPMLFFLLYYLLRFRNLIVYAGNIYAAILPAFVSYITTVRYHVFCYGTELLPLKNSGSLHCRIWKTLLRRAETIYYLTNTTKNLVELSGTCANLIRVYPRIDPPDYRISRKGSENLNINLLSVGRLVPHKGHSVLIEAVSMLPKNPPWRLSIVGKGPEWGKLARQVRRHALEERVFLLGELYTSQLIEQYKSADIFVFPSLDTENGIEGFGIVLLEAMAYGVAIIASRINAVVEVFDNNSRFADFVCPGSPQELKNALSALIADSERRFAMACAARHFLEERYVWKRP